MRTRKTRAPSISGSGRQSTYWQFRVFDRFVHVMVHTGDPEHAADPYQWSCAPLEKCRGVVDIWINSCHLSYERSQAQHSRVVDEGFRIGVIIGQAGEQRLGEFDRRR
jgi:hypothetical protein